MGASNLWGGGCLLVGGSKTFGRCLLAEGATPLDVAYL